nr:hypothetical protein [Paenibacillus mucilaginosus]
MPGCAAPAQTAGGQAGEQQRRQRAEPEGGQEQRPRNEELPAAAFICIA